MAKGKTLNTAQCAEILKAMGNETRLGILRLLFEQERSVSEICQALDLEQHFVSRHLSVLRNAGLVQTRRQAQNVFYSLHPDMAQPDSDTIHLGFFQLHFPTQNPTADE